MPTEVPEYVDTPTTLTKLTIAELTEKSLTGAGAFDVLMAAAVPHLEKEFTAGRIRGPEYSEVYLGLVNQVMQIALSFVLQKRKNDLEAQVLEETIQNAKLQGRVLVAEECKSRAEFDLLQANTLKAAQEILLLTQKVATEKAQTQAIGVDADSVIGKQKALYGAQTKGFESDALQKAAKLLIDAWNVRRTTDEGTVADDTNKLDDPTVGAFVQKLKDSLAIA